MAKKLGAPVQSHDIEAELNCLAEEIQHANWHWSETSRLFLTPEASPEVKDSCRGLLGQHNLDRKDRVERLRAIARRCAAEVAAKLFHAATCLSTTSGAGVPELLSEALSVATTSGGTSPNIPSENLSPVTSLKKAARLLGRPNEDSGVRWLKKSIEEGDIRAVCVSRQGYQFDKTQFPENSWPEPNSR